MPQKLIDFVDLFANAIIVYANRKKMSPVGRRPRTEAEASPSDENYQYSAEDYQIEKCLNPTKTRVLLEIVSGEERDAHLERGYQYLAKLIDYMAEDKWDSDKILHLRYLLQSYRTIKTKYLSAERFSNDNWLELEALIYRSGLTLYRLMDGFDETVQILRAPESDSEEEGLQELYHTVRLTRCKKGVAAEKGNVLAGGANKLVDAALKTASIEPLSDLGASFRDVFDYLECRDFKLFSEKLSQVIDAEKKNISFNQSRSALENAARLEEQQANTTLELKALKEELTAVKESMSRSCLETRPIQRVQHSASENAEKRSINQEPHQQLLSMLETQSTLIASLQSEVALLRQAHGEQKATLDAQALIIKSLKDASVNGRTNVWKTRSLIAQSLQAGEVPPPSLDDRELPVSMKDDGQNDGQRARVQEPDTSFQISF
jgi:hypothetical protein